MTQAEAKAKATAAGIPEEDQTPEVLIGFGMDIPSPTAGVQTPVLYLPDAVKADLAALEAEAKANNLPVGIIKKVLGVVGFLRGAGLFLVLMSVLALTSCDNKKAIESTEKADESATVTHEQHLAFEEAFIGYYRSNELARINAWFDKASSSVTRKIMVDVKKPKTMVDGVVTEEFVVKEERSVIQVATARGLENQRLELISIMEGNVALMRQQQAAISQNAANTHAYLAGLKNYFKQQADTYAALQAAEVQLQNLILQIAGKSPSAEPYKIQPSASSVPAPVVNTVNLPGAEAVQKTDH